MPVNSSPANSVENVPPLLDILSRSVGWRGRPSAASVLAVMQELEEQAKQTGHKIQTLREAKGWSREELGWRAKVSSKTIERIEKGQVEGRLGTLRSIAKGLEVDEFDILPEPATPLGIPLGGRVDAGFIEFRAHVDKLNERLDEIETAVQDARIDRDAVLELLERQSAILERIEQLVSVLGNVQVIREEPAAAEALPSVSEVDPPSTRDATQAQPNADRPSGQAPNQRRNPA